MVARPVTQRRVARSEWTKLRSLRSTRWSLLATLAPDHRDRRPRLHRLRVALATPEPRGRHDFHPLSANLAGINFAQLAIGVLGVLAITAEYSTGMIRSTFGGRAQAPAGALGQGARLRRGRASRSACRRSSSSSSPARRSSPASTSTSASPTRGLQGAVRGRPFLTVMGLFGLGLGAIIRSTAGAIAALAGIVFVLPPIVGLLPASLAELDRPVSAEQRRRRDLDDQPRSEHARALGGLRRLLRLRGAGDRDRRGPDGSPRHLNQADRPRRVDGTASMPIRAARSAV